jgi:hypothetical protein
MKRTPSAKSGKESLQPTKKKNSMTSAPYTEAQWQ